ncbi:gp436 family protein [Aliiroseovarius lamellibrachiae]|uniref:gp436 family protein n=1 Tax=Aliiroseovarius lamellibrachiae TaxID=1924933 RepID=UPI001BDFBB0B|nr:DUF1320 domain-containing protein [Aliiroseovarius lamellibrachiae]MBT2131221.1 DUF1320 family protein [Aliiroseovarius lamellibrachiae]
MTYATQDDIVTLYSEDALYVADRDGDGVVDAEAVARALRSAGGEIDSYIGIRYTLPIPGEHELLKQFCVDISVYRLASSRDVLTEEHRTRYDDAIKHLIKIGEGKASLNLPGPVNPDTGEETTPAKPRPIVTGGPEREFTRPKMRGL